MLYDQAQIALNLLEARQATGVEVYAWVARGIFDYVARELTHPRGGFYSAEDADSLLAAGDPAHAEGAFYVWTKDEVDAALGEEAAFFCAHYGVKSGGNVDPAHDPQGELAGKCVLMQQRPLAQTAADLGLTLDAAVEQLLRAFEKLRAVRAQRPRPHRDDKILAAWNGLMISALAKGHQVLAGAARQEDSPGLQAATRAAEFLRAELWDERSGTLYRAWREGRGDVPGFAEDYAYLIQGLLDLYEAGFELRWLQWAERLQDRMDAAFWDAERGGYFNSRADDASVLVRMKEDYDGAEPAPNSVAVANLVRLDWLLGRPGARDKALATVAALRPQWSAHPHALPQMLCAVEMTLEPPRTVVLAGDRTAADFRALAAVLHERLGPRRAILHADGGEAQAWLAERRPYLAETAARGGVPTAFVCEEYACRQPASTPGELRSVLWGGRADS